LSEPLSGLTPGQKRTGGSHGALSRFPLLPE